MSRLDRSIAAIAIVLAFPAAAASQQSRTCRVDEVEVTRLDIGGMACDNCTLVRPDDPRESRWEFGSEPTVTEVESGSAVAGVLEPGDVIVAVDGHLITTPEGGRRFRRPSGPSVTLRIRRDNRAMTVAARTETTCERMQRRATVAVRDRTASIDSVNITSAGAAIFPSREPVTLPLLLPEGWIGMSFQCSNCQVWLARDSSRAWVFPEPPSVHSVERGGPAERAGLRAGDRLVTVDGIDITTRTGGRRFGGVIPGETVRLGYERSGRSGIVELLVGNRPGSGALVGRVANDAVTVQTGVVRYSGRLGDTMIEVTGEPVTVTQSDEETIIRSSTITVRLRRSGSERR